ncbi:hypothetical protein H1R16_10235 [Marnyiella aurantia]|uniref:Uncharacterized protein n=1 Tax=Marnyiella aurantia TaxID=2758037 RepID=A0A7D7LT39_9FLAO|nr:hypothetical protein [Marnyiella aurantia]MBA5246567.1 hypothetical protein [Marnyiella aurantia]QMS98073.1 hypothetical protein H1R16_10235 [Marnyiella aurantia]
MKKFLFEQQSNHEEPKKRKKNGCLIAVLTLFGLFFIYFLGLIWWSENTESGRKHQADLSEQKRVKSSDFLHSNEPKTQEQKIDSAKLVRQKELENPELHLSNLQKELDNKNLTNVQKEEIEIEIKKIRSQKWAKKNINALDNSNPKLERAVKKVMNDDKSFEHVSTKYSFTKNEVIATMTYRGSNAFGAKVIEQITGTFDYDGNLVSVQD